MAEHEKFTPGFFHPELSGGKNALLPITGVSGGPLCCTLAFKIMDE